MFLKLVLAGVVLASNNAAAAVGIGAAGIQRRQQWRTALLFALFEAVMPAIGLLLGHQLSVSLHQSAHWFGAILLALVGVYTFFQKENEETEKTTNGSTWKTWLLAIILSLDNLTVGFGLGVMRVPWIDASLTFGAISLLMTILALETGRWLGRSLRMPVHQFAGALLVVIACVFAL